MERKRCINIDWLELYCLEDSIGYPHDAEFFRKAGLHVVEREYGTPVYHEMFTIYDHHNQPLIEVRRNPKSAVGRQLHGVLDPNACHIRLSNRTCYFNHPTKLLQDFIEQYGFHYQRISRIDIAYDFTLFDYGDQPSVFMERYFKHRYSKINQANIRAHGTDLWDGRLWNSVSWGNPKSMIGTKFYNKKMELEQVRDKPYIRQAWCAAGLVDDADTLTKYTQVDGEVVPTHPDIWRVEFSIKSSTRNWFIIENVQGQKKKIQSIRHTLDMYQDRAQLWTMFLSLADHYFHFKKFQEGVRKDRCEDKRLFDFNSNNTYYKLENVKTIESPDKANKRLRLMLENYRDQHVDPDTFKACNTLIAKLYEEYHTVSMPMPWNMTEVKAMRLLLKHRMEARRPINETLEELMTLLENGDIY